MDKDTPLYGRALLKMRDLLRQRSDLVSRNKTGEDNVFYLPQSCYFYDTIKLESDQPLSRSGVSDVYRGTCGKQRVALKVMRFNMDSMRKAQKVRIFIRPPFCASHDQLSATFRTFTTR
jgi:hypothetical protein